MKSRCMKSFKKRTQEKRIILKEDKIKDFCDSLKRNVWIIGAQKEIKKRLGTKFCQEKL